MKSIIYKGNRRFMRIVACFIITSFLVTSMMPARMTYAQTISATPELPLPGVMVHTSPAFTPPVLRGIKIDPANSFQFDFILDSGNESLKDDNLRIEANKLIRYFLASLTIPEDDLWVNLSPTESDRIVPEEFGLTEMGRDLLAQDYLLKQLTSSLIYPESDLGNAFWQQIHKKAQRFYGKGNIPLDTLNKIWIVPDKATIYQNGNIAFITESHLKVMLKENRATEHPHTTQIIKELIIPEIEREINTGKNFAKLRQIYHSLILAKWYKQTLKESILNQTYADQRKVSGINILDKDIKQKIYQQYLKAFQTGAFDYIKEEYDQNTQEIIPQKYFSGGLAMRVPLKISTDSGALAEATPVGQLSWIKGIYQNFDGSEKDSAMTAKQEAEPVATEEDLKRISLDILENTDRIYRFINGRMKSELNDPENTYSKTLRWRKLLAQTGIIDPTGATVEEEKFIKELVRDLKNEDLDIELRKKVASTLSRGFSQWGDQAEEIVSIFIKILEDKIYDKDLRKEAAHALGQGYLYWGDQSEKIVSLLLQLLEHEIERSERLPPVDEEWYDMFLSEAVIYALGKSASYWGEQSKKVITVLLNVLNKPNFDLSSEIKASKALGDNVLYWPDQSGWIISQLIKALENNSSKPHVAYVLSQSISRWGNKAEEIMDILLERFTGEKLGTLPEGVNEAISRGILHDEKLARKFIPKVMTRMLLQEPRLPDPVIVEALGKRVVQWGDFREEVSLFLMKILPKPGIAKALGKVITEEDLLAEIMIPKLTSALAQGTWVAVKEEEALAEAAAKTLGESASQWGEHAEKIIYFLKRSFRQNSRRSETLLEATAYALGRGASHWKDRADDIISVFLKIVENPNDYHYRIWDPVSYALGEGILYGSDVDENLSMFIDILKNKSLSDTKNRLIILMAINALSAHVLQGGEPSEEIISILLQLVRNSGWPLYLKNAATKALCENVLQWGAQADEIAFTLMEMLITVYSQSYPLQEAITQALKIAREKGIFESLSAQQIAQYRSVLHETRRAQGRIIQNDSLNFIQISILSSYFTIKGELSSEDIQYLSEIIDITQNEYILGKAISMLRNLAANGSNDAQLALEGKVARVISQRRDDVAAALKVHDKIILEAVIDSQRQTSLIPILVGEEFPITLRRKAIESVSKIDAKYKISPTIKADLKEAFGLLLEEEKRSWEGASKGADPDVRQALILRIRSIVEKSQREIDFIRNINTLGYKLIPENLTLGSQQFLKMWIYEALINGESEEAIRQELETQIIPTLRVLESVKGYFPNMGAEIQEPKVDDFEDEQRSHIGLSNLFMQVPTLHRVGKSNMGGGEDGGPEFRLLPSSYPIVLLVMAMHLRLGLINQNSTYAMTIQGSLDKEAFFILSLSLFSFNYGATRYANLDIGVDEFDTLQFGNLYTSYIGATVDTETGNMLDDTQTLFNDKTFQWVENFLKMQKAAGQDPIDLLSFLTDILTRDVEVKAFLSLYAYEALKEDGDLEMKAVYNQGKGEIAAFLSQLQDEEGRDVFTPDEVNIFLGKKDFDFYFPGTNGAAHTLNEDNVRPILDKLQKHFQENIGDFKEYEQKIRGFIARLKDHYYAQHPIAKAMHDQLKEGFDQMHAVIPTEEELIKRLFDGLLPDTQLEEVVRVLGAIGPEKSLAPLTSTKPSEAVTSAIKTIEGRIRSDSAMTSAKPSQERASHKEAVGGVDFNPDQIKLNVQRGGSNFHIPNGDVQINSIHINGLKPVILNVTPIQNLPAIFGALPISTPNEARHELSA